MGKKDAQRRKGNTVAASSARAGQLLGQDSAGFVGFGTAAESGFVPLLGGEDGEDGAVPGEIRLLLRKMHKKDLTTRLKALQEFQEAVGGLEEEELLAVLPYWPELYSKLGTDWDRRVRELAHTCLAGLARAAGRSLAPHLRALAGVWWCGQSDPHAPAAAAARTGWEAAFLTAAKQTGALQHCQSEILSLVTELLTVATAASLSDPRTTPPEEREARYQRGLVMALGGLGRAAPILPASQGLNSLLERPQFWKLARHQAGAVRAAWHITVGELCRTQTDTMQPHTAKLGPAVLGALGETEAAPAGAAWNAALHLTAALPAAWESARPRDKVFPAVFRVVAGATNATTVFPFLLPLLAALPIPVMADRATFLQSWFSSLQASLDSVTRAGEVEAVVAATVECCSLVASWPAPGPALAAQHLLHLVLRSLQEERLANSGLHSALTRYLPSWQEEASQQFWPDLQAHLLDTVRKAEELPGSTRVLLVALPAGPPRAAVLSDLWAYLVNQSEQGTNLSGALSGLAALLELAGSEQLFPPEDLAVLLSCVAGAARDPGAVEASCLLALRLAGDGAVTTPLTELALQDETGQAALHLANAIKRPEFTALAEKWLAEPELRAGAAARATSLVEGAGRGEEHLGWRAGLVALLGAGLTLPRPLLEPLLDSLVTGLGHASPHPALVGMAAQLGTLLQDDSSAWRDLALNLFRLDRGEDPAVRAAWLLGSPTILPGLVTSVRDSLQHNDTSVTELDCLQDKITRLLQVSLTV